MDLLQLVVYGTAIFLGGIIGFRIMRNRDRGNPSGGAESLPIMGGMFMFEEWIPKNGHEKNIIMGKIFTTGYVVLAMYFPFFWVFVIMNIIFHLEHFKEDDSRV